MPLKTLFSEQIDAIKLFMSAPGQTMRVLRYEPDVEPVLEKVVLKLDDDEDNSHVMVPCRSSCHEWKQYLHDLLQEIIEQNEQHREGLKSVGVELPSPDDISERSLLDQILEKYISDVADCLPAWSGNYIIVICPTEITNERAFKLAVESLAKYTRSPLAKFLIFDRQTNPILHDITEQTDRASVQVFEFSPEEIEKRVKTDLESGDLNPQERRQYTAMLGAYAVSRQNYEEAEEAQKKTLKMIQEDGGRSEEAAALYNLGNTYLAQDKSELAEQCYAQAIELGVQEELHGLVAMALTNLGIALQGRGEFEQALESLEIAQRTFNAINNPPGEAYSLDNKAQVFYREGHHEEAERAWLDALAIYDGITADMFAKVRETGREDILDKLKKFYEAT